MPNNTNSLNFLKERLVNQVTGHQLSLVIRYSRNDCLWCELPAKAGIQKFFRNLMSLV
jgi:hypothetical protein